MKITIDSLEHIGQAAQTFVRHMGPARVFAFYGGMGAGKTTFVKAVCEALGVADVITSPTFAIVNEYEMQSPAPSPLPPGVTTVFHFDFYRIKRLEEVYDMGYEDYFYNPHALCFIEWPELVEELLPEDAVRVDIAEVAGGQREVSWP